MDRQELRDHVRAQLDVDEEELSNDMLDFFLGEAFQRTLAEEAKWPFLEMEWELTFVDGEPVALPSDLAQIESVYLYGVDQLLFLAHGFAEQTFGRDGTVGQTRFFSVRNSRIYPWPAPGNDFKDILVTGWRKPTPFFSGDAGAEPDCDERLHSALVWYACSLMQAVNEEDVYDSIYYKKWQDVAKAARDDIMRPDPTRRRIYNGGIYKLRGNNIANQWTVN